MLELEVNSNFCFFKKEIEIEISMMLEILGYMDTFTSGIYLLPIIGRFE